ncbi:hypothetical protein CERSUDRAFT_95639 [Gelatoporia subvermispora B]|uniref:Carrier domain-containing protein n=1 Tax=Ceriporiopsis subvermispora (strain B) TaxID=914234 RepID=M2PJB9_CERS8|nr:hypothetical protein CERSUDRAFT_95639 [Gelatoporia subvermispora B]
MLTSALLPDCFALQCTERPDDILYHVVHVPTNGLDLNIVSKSKGEFLRDSQQAAGYLRMTGTERRNPGEPVRAVSIIMRHGYACLTMFVAASLNRLAPVLISSHNTAEMISVLVHDSNSTAIIVDSEHMELASQIKQQLPLIHVIHFEQLSSLGSLAAEDFKPFVALTEEEYLSEKDTPCYYMHTSGSTGHPKLIPEIHSCWWDKVHRYTAPNPGRPTIVMAHIQHTQGVLRFLALPWVSRDIPVLVESKRPFNSELLCRLFEHFPGATCASPPSILEEICNGGPKLIESLASAYRVLFAGAPLSPVAGDNLVRGGVRLMTAFGSTETGQLTVLDVASDDPFDWQYMRLLDEDQICMVPIPDSDGLCQLVVKPGRFVSADLVNFSNPPGYFSGDLFKRHPTNFVETHGTAWLGAATFSDPGTALASIWSLIDRANGSLPQHSRIVKELVIVAASAKPFVLSDKGTVREYQTLRLYEQEIENAYTEFERGSISGTLPLPGDEVGILTYIRDTVEQLLGKKITDTTNFFDSGMDSLIATSCRSRIIPLAQLRGWTTLPRNVLYHYPTICTLHHHIIGSGTSSESIAEQMNVHNLVSNLTNSWSLLKVPNKRLTATSSDDPWVILLTGARGALGRQLLPLFVASQRVYNVYCLDRRLDPSHAATRQRLPSDHSLPSEKVKRWEMDVSKPTLGLQDEEIHLIQNNVTHIVHCAWEVNFNHPLGRFVDTHIKGIQTLVEIAMSTQREVVPRLIFISSIAGVLNHADSRAIEERCYYDPEVSADYGYGQSKYVAERLLAHASEKTGLPVTIIRAGQLSGCTTTGEWNENEVYPIFFRSCHLLRRIPNTIPNARWVPIDLAAQAIFEIVQHDTTSGAPLTASGGTVETIPLASWIQAVQEAKEDIPAKRLLQVFDGWESDARWSTTKSLSVENTRGVSDVAGGIPLTYGLVSLYWRYATRHLTAFESNAVVPDGN